MAHERMLKSKCHLSSSPIIQNSIDCVQVKADFCILDCVIVWKTPTIVTSVKKTKRKAY